MRIIVIGSGKVGKTIIKHTAKEGHEITIIDKNAKVVENIINQYDVMGIIGNGATYDIQKSARVDKADLVISTTSSDEVNILSCIVAKQLGAKATVARVRSYEYSSQISMMSNQLGINMTINPELETANEIINIINFPEAIRVDSFAKGKVELVEIFVPEKNPIIGKKLVELHELYKIQILVCAIQRGEEVFIPDGNSVIMGKDKIYITASKENVKAFAQKLGLFDSKIKDLLIIGGGKISLYLAENLLKNKYDVKIIEKNYDRCMELTDLLPAATIIYGDGTDQELLLDEGVTSIDGIIPLTDSDEENIIISLFADKQKAKKLITKINKHSFVNLVETIGMSSVVSPKEITAQKILSYIRAKSNIHGSNVRTLYKLVNNEVEAIEFLAKDDKKIVNKCLKDLQLKKNILIAAIIRDNNVIIPRGNDFIKKDDSVIVICKDHFLDDLTDILE